MTALNLREECLGKWRGLLPAIGMDSRYLTGRNGPCPMCDGKDRWRFSDYQSAGGWVCTHCGKGDGIELAMRFKGWDWKTAATELRALAGSVQSNPARRRSNEDRNREALNGLWRAARPVESGDVVDNYLTERGIALKRWPIELRAIDKCRYYDPDKNASPRWFPAMLARVTAPDGKPASIHRTYLSGLGSKADVPNARRMMPGALPKGSAVRLAAAKASIGIAEGIETALSASILSGLPVWSAIATGPLVSWNPPAGVTHVTIFADNDPSFGGQSAAFGLAFRLKTAGYVVRVEMPFDMGKDFNDVLRATPTADMLNAAAPIYFNGGGHGRQDAEGHAGI